MTPQAAAVGTAEPAAPRRASGPHRPATPAGGRSRRAARWRRHRRQYLAFAALVAPNVLVIAAFSYWPVLYNAYLSFTSWDFAAPVPVWAGLANYVDLFTDPEFGTVLLNTLVFSGAIVVGSLVLGLAVALLLNQRLRLRGAVRTLAFAPHILSGAAVATIWLFLFDPNYGLIRAFLQPLGLTSPNWITDPTWALPAVILVYLWKNIGFTAIVYIAGLQGMPPELYEAAALDGAGSWTMFRRITLPLLSPVTFFLLVTTIIGTFQAFDVIAVMTDGGPGGATTTLSWYVYQQAFRALDAGHSAAAAVLMFVLLLGITAVQTIYVERKVHYR